MNNVTIIRKADFENGDLLILNLPEDLCNEKMLSGVRFWLDSINRPLSRVLFSKAATKPGNQQQHTIILHVESNDSHIVKAVKENVASNEIIARTLGMQTTRKQTKFDLMIGRLDRDLSEFLVATDVPAGELDTPNYQTLKHHADDLMGVGQKALQNLKERLDKEEPKKGHSNADEDTKDS